MHIKLLVQSNTTRQVLKEQQLLLCNFSCPTRDSNTHWCSWASTRSCTCNKFKKSQYSGSYSLIQVIKDDHKPQTHSQRGKGNRSPVCKQDLKKKKSLYWSLKLNFWGFIALNHIINANMMLFYELTLTSLSQVVVLVACITNTFVWAY